MRAAPRGSAYLLCPAFPLVPLRCISTASTTEAMTTLSDAVCSPIDIPIPVGCCVCCVASHLCPRTQGQLLASCCVNPKVERCPLPRGRHLPNLQSSFQPSSRHPTATSKGPSSFDSQGSLQAQFTGPRKTDSNCICARLAQWETHSAAYPTGGVHCVAQRQQPRPPLQSCT